MSVQIATGAHQSTRGIAVCWCALLPLSSLAGAGPRAVRLAPTVHYAGYPEPTSAPV